MAAEPVVYGASSRPPRGDYARAQADYTCAQNYAAYTPADHATFRQLYERQARLLPGLACDEFIAALPQLQGGQGTPEQIPRFEAINQRLRAATGWEIVAVPGLIPDLAFFNLLAARQFPVTDWIRRPEELDYIVEPDVFHDLFGHVPLLFDPVFAAHMQAYGAGGQKAHRLGACEALSRLYWFTIEFGLMRQAHKPQSSSNRPDSDEVSAGFGVRAYGAGILSSSGELRHSVTSALPQRLLLDVPRVLRTRYKIDSYQAMYFVIDSFQQLFEVTAPDFTPFYAALKELPALEPGQILPSDSAMTALSNAS